MQLRTFLVLVLLPVTILAEEPQKAIASLQPLNNSGVGGAIRFTGPAGAVHITGEVTGLSEGQHGFHIHEFGDCSAADGKSAGGHFNPDGHDHGAPTSNNRHAGDLGNIQGTASATKISLKDSQISLEGKSSIIGRSVVIHKAKDDLKSQPSGDAGARIACGVIGVAK